MKQRKETTEGELSESQKQEQEWAAVLAELSAAKEEEIAAAKKQIEDKTAELANTDMKLADAKEDILQSKAALEEDQEFLVKGLSCRTTRPQLAGSSSGVCRVAVLCCFGR